MGMCGLMALVSFLNPISYPSSPSLYSSVGGYGTSDTADQYFRHIMEETGTLILWPSKLKVGAKSKKGVCLCVCSVCTCTASLLYHCIPVMFWM